MIKGQQRVVDLGENPTQKKIHYPTKITQALLKSSVYLLSGKNKSHSGINIKVGKTNSKMLNREVLGEPST